MPTKATGVAKAHYFHGEANSLGGVIEKPLYKVVPSQATVSLPSVGGHAQQRTDAFNFEEIVSCSAAYTRVAGGHHQVGGPASTTVTSVVEGLNILEIVTADRVVAQISVEHPVNGGDPLISFAGSHFEGLKIGGHDANPTLNFGLPSSGPGAGGHQPVDWLLFHKTGSSQAATLVKGAQAGGKDFQWVIDRYGWMTSADPKALAPALCSLVNGLSSSVPGTSFGHVLHVPNFGKIFFGEVLASSPTSVHLTMIRVELGCAVNGQLGVASARGIGSTVPP